MFNKKFIAFTLAEVLVTLAVIGITAALTIPTVVQNYQKKMYVTQLKKNYSNITNAFKTAMANDGVTRLTETSLWVSAPVDASGHGIEYGELFESPDFRREFLKIFKTLAIYTSAEGSPEPQMVSYKSLSGSSSGEAKIYGVYLADGSIFVLEGLSNEPYRAQCGKDDCKSLRDFQDDRKSSTNLWEVVGDVVIDVNGLKGPNTIGRDVFVFVLGNDGNLYPAGGREYAVWDAYGGECNGNKVRTCSYYWEGNGDCDPNNKNREGDGCAARIIESGWKMDY